MQYSQPDFWEKLCFDSDTHGARRFALYITVKRKLCWDKVSQICHRTSLN